MAVNFSLGGNLGAFPLDVTVGPLVAQALEAARLASVSGPSGVDGELAVRLLLRVYLPTRRRTGKIDE